MMEEESRDRSQAAASNPTRENQPSAEELIKIVDRKGIVKEIPRSEYERKKRSRKKRGERRSFSYGNVLSVVLILAIMIIAAYVALKFVQ